MKKFFQNALLAAAVMGMWLVGAASAQVSPSDTPQPVAIVAFSGYDELMSDIGFVGKLADNPGLAGMAEMGLQMATGGQELAGLDKSEPWGFLVQTDGAQFTMFGFLPVTDLDQFLGALELMVGESQDAGGGLVELNVQGQTLFVKQGHGWAFIADSPEALANTPDDPVAALDGLHEAYDLAVKVNSQNIPEAFRQMAIGMLQMGVQAGMQKMPGESDEDFALRSKMIEQSMEQVQTAINEIDTLTVGLAIDQEASSVYLDCVVTVMEGSKIAGQLAASEGMTTNFAGFIVPDAAMSLNTASQIAEADVDQMVAAIEAMRTNAVRDLSQQGLGDDEIKVVKGMLNSLIDVLVATIQGRRFDGGALLLLDESQAAFVAGLHVADSAKLEDVLKQLAALVIKDDPQAADAIKLDALVHQGVRFHTMTVPAEMIPDEKLVAILGGSAEIVVGFGDDSAYIAAGRDAVKTLQQVIDDCRADAGKDVPLASLTMAAGPIARFVAGVAEEDHVKQIAAMMAGMLAQSAGKDRLAITVTIIPRGEKVRIEIEEGLVKLLGSLPMLMMSAGPAPGGF